MISFGAKYINSTTVQKIDTRTGAESPCKVSCVELNPRDDKDLKAVREAVYDWESPDEYDAQILSYMENCANPNEENASYLKKMKFYAITSQKKNFNNLESGDILALSQIIEGDNVELKYLQVKPLGLSSFLKHQKIKYLGSKMIDLISFLFPDKDITLCSNPRAYNFYLKNGFEKNGRGSFFIKRHKNQPKDKD